MYVHVNSQSLDMKVHKISLLESKEKVKLYDKRHIALALWSKSNLCVK